MSMLRKSLIKACVVGVGVVGCIIAAGWSLGFAAANFLPVGVTQEKAAMAIGDYMVYVMGTLVVLGFGMGLYKMLEGVVYGWLVKSLNMIAEGTTALRFGTAVGHRDSPVTKLGLYAVYTTTHGDLGEVIRDRQPYKGIFDGRVTVVTLNAKKCS